MAEQKWTTWRAKKGGVILYHPNISHGKIMDFTGGRKDDAVEGLRPRSQAE